MIESASEVPGRHNGRGVPPAGVEDLSASLGTGDLRDGTILKGQRVLLVGDGRAGRVLARLLSDQGAELDHVLPVETSSADRARVATDTRERVVDVSSEIARNQLQEDARGSDVVIDACPADAHMRDVLGLDDVTVRERGVIYCSFTALPDDFPGARGLAAEDVLVAAEVGLNRLGVSTRQPEPLPVASTYGAIWGAILVAAALRARQEGSRGQEIQVPLMAAALTVVGRSLVNLDNPALSDPLNLPRLPIADIYECEDGRFVQNHGTFARFAQVLCSVMGREEWTDEAVEALAALPTRAEARRWRQRFAAAFAERPALEWEQRLNAAGGCCTMCRSREEWQAELHAHRARILTSERSERTGDDSSVGAAVRVWSSASRGHGAEGSRRTNDLWPRQKHPVDPTAPLSGVRVVDFCIILAGPTCGRTLAELGADVIKVDDPNRPVSPYGWLDVNRGKRSALIDLKSVAGRAVARKLVRSADVVLENYRDGKLAALGLGYENVREINPDVVYASMNAFDYGGGWSERAGWEHSAQAATGMQVARQEGGVPRAVPFPVNDYATGLLAAFGVLVALFGRDAGAASARVAASLARSASFIQLDAFAGGARDGVAGTAGRTSRTVRVTDGRVRVLHPVGSPSRPILSRSTVDEISRLSAHEAVELLRSRGLESAVERSPRDLLAESSLTDGGFIVSWEHPRWGTLRQAFSNMGSTSFHTSAGWPAPDPGDDTMEVLAGLGLDKDAILELAESGVIRDTLPLFPTAPAPVST